MAINTEGVRTDATLPNYYRQPQDTPAPGSTTVDPSREEPATENPPRPEVVAAVDQELAPDATPEQRERAYVLIEEYVDGVGGIGDAGIVEDALPARASTLLEEAGLPTRAQSARVEGERILSLDGDEARATAFAEAYANAGSPAAQTALIEAVFAGGADPVDSWMSPEFVNDLVEDGKLSQSGRGALAEAFTHAYNNRLVSTETVPAKPGDPEYDWQENPDHNIDRLPLDGVIWDYSGYGYDQRLENAEQVDELLEFLGSSQGPEVAEFRENYARHLIDTYVTDPNVQLDDANVSREAAAGIAALLLSDPSNPDAAVDVLGLMSPEERATFYDYAADAKNLFTADQLIPGGAYTDDDIARAESAAQPDPLAGVIQSIADSDAYAARALAVELARMPQNKGAWFEDGHDDRGFPQSGYEARANAMTNLFAEHSTAILDELSAYDDSGARGLGEDTDLKQFEANGRDLAALLELTVFNPKTDTAARDDARSAVLGYVGEQARLIEASRDNPNSAGYLDASGRLVVLSAASDVAVDRGFEALQADIEARQEAIGFVVDLALAAVPLSSRLSDEFKGSIDDLFANNPLVKEALNGLTGQVIDSATGQLTDAAKQQLYANLESDPELAALVERQTVADAFRESILGAVADERDRADIQRDANSLADDISEND